MSAPSKTEREISGLMKASKVRKIIIPGRGIGMSSAGEGLVLYQDLERLLAESDQIIEALKTKFYAYLRSQPLRQKIPRVAFTPSEVTVLLNTGFLTSAQSRFDSANTFTSPVKPGTPTSIASVSKAASGSMEAIGGEGAVHRAGGGIRGINVHGNPPGSEEPDRDIQLGVSEFQLALPNMGPYLRLLFAARSHLISLIKKSRYQEAPLYLLRERWDGGISADDPAAKAKKYRGEFAGVLPSKTRKWRQFYGLSFEWVLAECLGAGLLELFETRSVGQAARIT
ncbi:MAG: hypothetical protein LQ342_004538 [Letrouitia transgressa]|nr:MAG: hypothetical protein LQ342_004538 [Letrouitia transgressa]